MIAHPNAVKVTGVATLLDRPSNHSHLTDQRTADVALGPRLTIPTAVAEKWAHTLLGMGLQAWTKPYKEHQAYSLINPLCKVGIVTAVDIDNGQMTIEGIVYALDFPDVIDAIRTKNLGLCVSMRRYLVEKVDEGTVCLSEAIFTGVNLMLKESCGFSETSIRLAGV